MPANCQYLKFRCIFPFIPNISIQQKCFEGKLIPEKVSEKTFHKNNFLYLFTKIEYINNERRILNIVIRHIVIKRVLEHSVSNKRSINKSRRFINNTKCSGSPIYHIGYSNTVGNVAVVLFCWRPSYVHFRRL